MLFTCNYLLILAIRLETAFIYIILELERGSLNIKYLSSIIQKELV
jgi:hypothetical protein